MRQYTSPLFIASVQRQASAKPFTDPVLDYC